MKFDWEKNVVWTNVVQRYIFRSLRMRYGILVSRHQACRRKMFSAFDHTKTQEHAKCVAISNKYCMLYCEKSISFDWDLVRLL